MIEDRRNKDQLEQQLKQAAENYVVQPSDEVWEKVSKELSASGSNKVIFLKWGAVAAALIVIIGLGLYFLQGSTTKNAVVPRGITKTVAPQEEHYTEENQLQKDKKDIVESDKLVFGEDKQKTEHNRKEVVAKNNNAILEVSKDNKKNNSLPFIANNTSFKHQEITLYPRETLHYPEEYIQSKIRSYIASKDIKTEIKKTSDIAFSAYFAPGMSYRKLDVNPVSPDRRFASGAVQNQTLVQLSERQQETPSQQGSAQQLQQSRDWGWGAGLRMEVTLHKKWEFETGLALQKTSYNITAYKPSSLADRDGQARYMMVEPLTVRDNSISNFAASSDMNPDNNKVAFDNQYLRAELPLLIGYNFGNPDKLSLSVMTGVGLTYLMNANAMEYDAGQNRYFTNPETGKDLRAWNSNLMLEISMDVPLSQHLGFSIGPSLEYQLMSSYKDNNAVAEFPYQIGMKAAIQLR
ncbi:MAG TPA: outer membrane beta-barrel protein [Chitinophagaceae bacterium]|nr:outer membrane beta-barrel protein [Chitinophagaceae bacterium]